MLTYELDLSAVTNWEQLLEEFAITFSIDSAYSKETEDLWEPLRVNFISDTEIIVYGLGRMAECLPREASKLRGIFDGIDESNGLLNVYYMNSRLR